MVCLYPKDTNIYVGGFLDNGICVLDPSVCNVSEEAGGSYELYMEHPFDRHEKYKLIAEDMIIKAPVPRTVIPAITLPEREICTVNTVADFYQKLPVYKNKTETDKSLDYIRAHPDGYKWSRYKAYAVGAYCVYMNHIYQATEASYGIYSEPRTPVQGGWTDLGSVSSSSTPAEYTAGTVYSPALTQGATVTKLADYNAVYAQIRDQQGRVGYYDKTKLTETTTAAEVIPQQTITEQLFRVYAVESEETTRVLKVYARHVSYDFAGNKMLDCKVEKTNVLDAIAVMQGALMEPDMRRIACEFESNEISEDWSYKNPINALLDPDDGLVPELKARLIRNNQDFFILKNDTPRQGITIEYGYNLRGVTWKRNIETAISRVVPRCGKKDDGYLYLEHGGTWVNGTWTQNNDIYVESADAASFPFSRIEILDAGFSVGDKYTPAGATEETTRTEANCREEMLKLAQERFTKDRCDGPEITLDVEFLLMGDTEQYKQYRGLQQVNLYDWLAIKTEAYETSAQVIAYEFDCLTGRYDAIKVGSVESFNRRLPGYRVVRESITYSKLAPDVISRIRTMNAPSGDSTGSAGGGAPGSGTIIEADVPVTDNDPLLAWDTQSKVGTVGETDLHVKMPPNPMDGIEEGTGDLTDNDYTVRVGTPSKKVKMLKVLKYIKDKILGFTQSGKNYPVQEDSNGKIFVNVPWTADGGNAATVNGKTVGTNVPANAVFTDTWDAMTGATSSANGTKGYINATPPKDGYNTKFWGADGSWKVPPGTYSLPLAASGTRGGVQIGYTKSGKNYPVQLDNEKMYVNVPWTADGGNAATVNGKTVGTNVPANAVFTDTTYSAGSGLALSGTTFRVDVPRVAESADHLPGKNSFQLREYTSGANYDLPSNAFYHIYEAKGSDANYGTQLALGITTQKAYYRRYSNGSWTDWEKILFATDIIDNLTSTDTDKSLSAKQGKVLNEAKANGKQATWLPSNGYNPLTSETGYFCYAVNPNIMVSQGSPTGFNPYATVFGDCSGTYKKMLYSDVFGRLAIWNSQDSAWKKIADITDIPAVINNLTSTSKTDALSANQGKVLSDRFNVIRYNSSQMGSAKNGATVNTDTMYTNAQTMGGYITRIKMRIVVPTITATTVIFSLVAALRPSTTQSDTGYIQCWETWNPTNRSYVNINANGNVFVQAEISGKDISFEAVFIT